MTGAAPPGGATPGYPIAVFGPFHPYRGGIAHHTTLLATTLAEHHPVLGINFTRLYPGILFPGRTQFDASRAPLAAPGVRIERLVDSIAPHTWPRAARAVRAHGTRLLVVQWWHPFFAPVCRALATSARRAGARVVFLCHNVLPHERSRLDAALVQFGLGAGDAFVVHSATDLERITALFPARPHVLTPLPAFTFFARGAIDRTQARATLGVEGPVVLFFGFIRAYKGLDVLLRAVAHARPRVPITLIVAGEFYEDRRPYDDLVEQLGIQDAVRIHDRYIPNEEVEGFFRAADLVVLPYRSATQSGIAQIALRFEIPVVVTRVGGLPEVVREGETGFTVPPEDPVALGEVLADFFVEARVTGMRPFLQNAADAFSWATMRAVLSRLGTALGLPSL